MCPLYDWENDKGDQVTVLRTLDDYQEPPTEEEAKGKEGPWKRVLVKAPATTRGPNWGAGKGFWIWIFIVIGGYLASRNTWV